MGFYNFSMRPVLVRSNRECKSAGKRLGKVDSLEKCMLSVWSYGERFFIFGKGRKEHHCWYEKTASEDCPEGWGFDRGYDFYKIDIPSRGVEENIELQMVTVAAAVYVLADTGTRWKAIATSVRDDGRGGKDTMALYQQGSRCALAFSGTDDAVDAMQDLTFVKYKACG